MKRRCVYRMPPLHLHPHPHPHPRPPLSHGRIRLSRVTVSDQLHTSVRGKLRVAIYSEFYPVAYRIPKPPGRPRYAGLDVDIIEGFAKAMGLEVQYVRIKDFYKILSVAGRFDDRIDVAIGGIGRTSWRRSETIEWSVPYFVVRRTVVFRLSDPIRRFPEDVTGVVAGTMGSTGSDDALQRLRTKFGEDGWQDHLDLRYKTTDAKDMKDLLSGKLQGLMRGSFVGSAIVAKHPKLLGMAEPWDVVSTENGPYGGEVFVFPCRRGSGIVAQLNSYLMGLSDSGALRRLSVKHGMI